MNNYTLYPSPFVVMDGNGYYTKHYFAGSERIASRPAGLYSAGATPQPLVKPVEGSTKQLDETAQNQLLRLNQYLKEYKMPEAKFKKASKAEKEKQHLYNILEFEVNNLPSGENKQQALILLAKGDLEILKTLLKVEPTAIKKGKRGIDIYYFHPDHLGTATFVSDANGEPYQFFLNLPFGELRSNREHHKKINYKCEQTMVEQRAGSWQIQNQRTELPFLAQSISFCIREFQLKNNLTHEQNPYKFNGKELDQETGLYYYGARYYNPRWSSFLSVAPLTYKFPSQSGYLYAYNNPVRFIDYKGLYGDETEANQQREAAINQGLNVGEVYKSGDEYLFNVYDEQGYYSANNVEFNVSKENPQTVNYNDLNKDGKLILIEASFHYRNGQGNPVIVDGSKIDLKGVDPDLFSNKKPGDVVPVNLFFTDPFGIGHVYGQLDFMYLGGDEVQILPNSYDFFVGAEKGYPWTESLEGFTRNFFTVIGHIVNGRGEPYDIIFHGSSKLKRFPK
jgi:RHS repeat-associated protein